MDTNEIIDKVNSLPIERRTFIIDSLLKSLNSTESDIEKEWFQVAKKRLEELRAGRVKPISGKKVFDEVWKKLSV